ncbi:MAG: hypothetical protein AB2L14_15345 [Candidatus Xenobiia bacterium LiM19]
MSNGESQKVVQIPEDTFRKMREKLKKQDERIKTLENQLTNIEQDRGGGGGGIDPAVLAQKEDELEQLRAKIKEVEAVIEDQKNQIERLSLTNPGDADATATSKELEEKEELIKFLMEREKQLLAALENQPQGQSQPSGGGSSHLQKGIQLLKKLEVEMKKREEILASIFSKMEKMKETMGLLEQDLLSIPTQEDVDNEVREAMKVSESAAPEEGAAEGAASYEVILERIKEQLGKSSELKTKLSHEQETIVIQRKGISQRFEFLNGNIDGLNNTIKDKEGRLNSARDFFEAKYTEWKAQDEARAKEMENLWGMFGTD